MTLPGSFILSVILLILSLLCLGTWANLLKAAGPKWRFELFAYDFALGVLIAALIGAFTFGTLGLDGFTVMDDLRLAGKRQDFFAFVAGSIFSLANLLLLGAISLSGIAVAFPICFGVAIMVGVGINNAGHPAGSLPALVAGSAAILAAVVLAAMAWKNYRALMKAAAQATAAAALASQETVSPSTPPSASKPKKARRKKATAGRAILIAVLGGLFMGGFSPLLNMAKEGENGLGPYSAVMIFAVGVLFSTFVCNLFFTNLPLQGVPLEFKEYLTEPGKQHLFGILAGAIWCIGAMAYSAVARAEGTAIVGAGWSYAMGQAPVIIAAVCGLIVWKELADAEGNPRPLLGATIVLLALGIGLISIAPLYGVH